MADTVWKIVLRKLLPSVDGMAGADMRTTGKVWFRKQNDQVDAFARASICPASAKSLRVTPPSLCVEREIETTL